MATELTRRLLKRRTKRKRREDASGDAVPSVVVHVICQLGNAEVLAVQVQVEANGVASRPGTIDDSWRALGAGRKARGAR